MILSVHATFGAAVASLVPSHPVVGFALGFASHLVLDAIPHSKEYKLISVENDQNKSPQLANSSDRKYKLIRDMTVVSLDAIAGLILAYLFFYDSANPWVFLIGAFGSLLPDGLTFLYLVTKHKALGAFFNFHADYIHNNIHINRFIGIILQFFTVTVLIGILMAVKYYYFLLI